MKVRGFTLGELIVVIAIITVFASLIFPIFGKARERAFLAQDVSQMKQIYEAIVLYEQDHEERSPHSLLMTYPYLNSKAVYCSPADPYGHGIPGYKDFPGDTPVVDSVRSSFRISYDYAYPCLAMFGFDEGYWNSTYRSDSQFNLLDIWFYNPLHETILDPTQIDFYRDRTFLNQILTDGSYRGLHQIARFGISTGLNCSWDPALGLL